jgi:hypothetical protein
MKTFAIGMTLGVALACGGWILADSAGANPAPPPLQLEVDLVDGSHIIGIPKREALSIQTAYAKLDIPLKQILTIKLAEERGTATLELRNGDKVNGRINLEPINLQTSFGNVRIGTENIKAISISFSGGGLAEILRHGLVAYYSFDNNAGSEKT